jgi:hypothetical protein
VFIIEVKGLFGSVQMWLWKKLMWAVSCGKTAVSWELWENWKPFGSNDCEV